MWQMMCNTLSVMYDMIWVWTCWAKTKRPTLWSHYAIMFWKIMLVDAFWCFLTSWDLVENVILEQTHVGTSRTLRSTTAFWAGVPAVSTSASPTFNCSGSGCMAEGDQDSMGRPYGPICWLKFFLGHIKNWSCHCRNKYFKVIAG